MRSPAASSARPGTVCHVLHRRRSVRWRARDRSGGDPGMGRVGTTAKAAGVRLFGCRSGWRSQSALRWWMVSAVAGCVGPRISRGPVPRKGGLTAPDVGGSRRRKTVGLSGHGSWFTVWRFDRRQLARDGHGPPLSTAPQSVIGRGRGSWSHSSRPPSRLQGARCGAGRVYPPVQRRSTWTNVDGGTSSSVHGRGPGSPPGPVGATIGRTVACYWRSPPPLRAARGALPDGVHLGFHIVLACLGVGLPTSCSSRTGSAAPERRDGDAATPRWSDHG
jgi:hypothetical protein